MKLKYIIVHVKLKIDLKKGSMMIILFIPTLVNDWKYSMFYQYVKFSVILYRNGGFIFNTRCVFEHFKGTYFTQMFTTVSTRRIMVRVWFSEEGWDGLGEG